MRLFGFERVMIWMDRLKFLEGEFIIYRMINFVIEKV